MKTGILPRCIREIRKQASEVNEFYYVYVVDNDNVLNGTVSLKKLIDCAVLHTDQKYCEYRYHFGKNRYSFGRSGQHHEKVRPGFPSGY